MLETYFGAPKTLRRLRAGPSGPYIDGFAASLERNGYSHSTAILYLRAAAHLSHFVQRQGGTLACIDFSMVGAFYGHMRNCRCPLSNGGKRNHHTYFGAKRYRDYLLQIGVCQCRAAPKIENLGPAPVVDFRQWLQKHRGAAESTIRQYSRGATELIDALGEDTARWDAKQVRAYFVERVDRRGGSTAEKLVTNLRVFLRFLSVHGQCQADLDQAVPAFASWRLAELPRYLTADQVDRLIAACDGGSPQRRRDRAIILLLVRLGLRAGDVARLRIADVEWEAGTLRVSGKGRYQVRLPLPLDVGEAIIGYLECRPQVCDNDYIFVRNMAPIRAFVRGDGVSSVVRRVMKRAGVVTPVKGAHTLRHTAATEMLRHGVPLDQIGMVLRHRGIDTTAYYAKADVNLLKQIAQPWPEVVP
jgi:site-specific recombinase XerD